MTRYLALFGAVACSVACQNDVICAAPDACHLDGLEDPVTHVCKADPVEDGFECDDGNACTTNDACTAGVCGGTTVTCTPQDDCHTVGGACDPNLGCVQTAKADGTACDDDNLCTTPDTCTAGVCSGPSTITCPGTASDACHTAPACIPSTGQCGTTTKSGPCDMALSPLSIDGCPYNVYGTYFSVGNTNVHMLLDSGSTSLALAASNCSNCTDITPTYQQGPNGSYIGTSTSATYGDKSTWSARTYSDDVTVLGTPDLAHMRIAAITSQNGFFSSGGCVLNPATEADNVYQGIVGLMGSAGAVPGTDAFMDKVTHLDHNAFSVLMCNPNGLIWFGGYDPNSMNGAPQFTDASVGAPYYAVNFNDVLLGGTTLGVSDYGPVVVDTGTSVLLLPDDAMNALVRVVTRDATFLNNFEATFFDNGECYAAAGGATSADLDAALPGLTFKFPKLDGTGTFNYTVTATQSYLQPMAVAGGGTGYCPGVSNSDITIFGAATMTQHVVVFDRDNKAVGFAPVADNVCDGL